MRLLVIGKLDTNVSTAIKIAQDRGAKVTQAQDIEAALDQLRSGKGADLILVDVYMEIKQLIDNLFSEHISIPVVAYGQKADSQAAVKAIKAGAKEYIPLPPEEELIAAILEAIAEESNTILYQSDIMGKVVDLAKQVAPSDASVLVTGESGTGKEVMARFIHTTSRRSKGPFISLNCAAIPDNLLESELFGHERGAFTGALTRRIGKFEEASGGTLLLDEISEMDIRLQAKLLRAIQEKEIDRVGGAKPVKVDIRIIATSNRDLQAEVKTGTFREDLLFRLNVIHLELPPLRERKEDISLFSEYFIKKYSDANAIPTRPLSDDAMNALQEHNWPGNIRELENTLHRAILLANGDTISKEAIMLTPLATDTAASECGSTTDDPNLVGRTVESVEKELILNTLDHCLGNRTQAANILGISIRTLRNKLKLYNDEVSNEATHQ